MCCLWQHTRAAPGRKNTPRGDTVEHPNDPVTDALRTLTGQVNKARSRSNWERIREIHAKVAKWLSNRLEDAS